MTDSFSKFWFALFCFVLALAAAGLLGFAIEPGIGLASDSYYYISGADTLYNGDGFGRIAGDGEFKATTHFPPMYSVFLLLPRALGGERIESATIVHQVILMLLLLLGAWLVYQMSASRFMSVVFILLIGFSPALLSVNSWMLSEGFFMLALTAVFACIFRYQRTARMQWVFLAGIMTGLSYLIRYVGVTVVPAVAIGIVLTRPRKSWWSLILYSAASAVLPILWLLRNLLVAGVTTNRTLGWHPVSIESINSGFKVMANWLLPSQISDSMHILIVLVVVAVITVMFIQLRRIGERQLTTETSIFWFPVIYFIFLLLSISIFDAATPLDGRVLSPIFLAVGLFVLAVMDRVVARLKQAETIRRGVWLGMLLFAGLTAIRGYKLAVALNMDGQGFASSTWRQSDLIEWLNSVSPGTVLYSNELDGIYLLTGRSAYQIPIKWDPVKAEIRDDFQDQMQAMFTRLEDESGYLLLFESLSGQQAFFPSEEELTQGLQLYDETSLGRVYIAE